MTPQERVDCIRAGIAAVRAAEAELRSRLPPPTREDPALLRALRDVMGLADRLESHIDIPGFDPEAIYARDAGLSTEMTAADFALLRELEGRAPRADHRAGLRALHLLLERYNRNEFWPPNSYFGIGEPEA